MKPRRAFSSGDILVAQVRDKQRAGQRFGVSVSAVGTPFRFRSMKR
jgi:hypothetical protein